MNNITNTQTSEVPFEVKMDSCIISTDKTKLDVDVIHRYLSEESYWSKGIARETVEKFLTHSLCFGVYVDDRQVGFGRLITDKAIFAYLADVFILPEHRGVGLSKLLVQAIHSHPELQTLRSWMLATRDAFGLYEQFGWVRLTEEDSKRYMKYRKQDNSL